MGEFGNVVIILALFVSVVSFISLLYGQIARVREAVVAGYYGIIVVSVLVVIASFALISALLNHDFSLSYVAQYSSTDLSLVYLISAFWAGQEGSLLFWLVILAVCIFFLLVFNWKERRDLFRYAILLLAGIQTFFLVVVTVPANPFKAAPFAMTEGQGLNPLLQHIVMAIHPPTLLVGYAVFAVPFAFAIAALILGRETEEWITMCRNWALFAWVLLSVGIFLGAYWAYEVLGWGGYWAWDPVENTSILPWFTGTALIHSFFIYRRKGLLKIWTIVLSVSTFLLCLAGTFITRSGIIQSVHAFGESPVGSYFLFSILVVLGGGGGLIAWQYSRLRTEFAEESIVSREYGYFLNNLMLYAFMAIVLILSVFPYFTEIFMGQKLSPSIETYNNLAIPLGLIYLLGIGICPLIKWKQTSFDSVKTDLIIPTALAIVSFGLIIVFWRGSPLGMLTLTAAVFGTIVLIQTTINNARTRSKAAKKGFISSLYYLFKNNNRHYGGFIAHLGIMLIFIGLVGSSLYASEQIVTLKEGESFSIEDFKLEYSKPYKRTQYINPEADRTEENIRRETVGATLTVSEGGKSIGEYTPRLVRFAYPESTTIAKVSIRREFLRDLFLAFQGLNEDGTITVQAKVNPLVSWLWVGSLVLFAGAIWAILPLGKKPKKERR